MEIAFSDMWQDHLLLGVSVYSPEVDIDLPYVLEVLPDLIILDWLMKLQKWDFHRRLIYT